MISEETTFTQELNQAQAALYRAISKVSDSDLADELDNYRSSITVILDDENRYARSDQSE